jgi:hypothetical protein
MTEEEYFPLVDSHQEEEEEGEDKQGKIFIQ